MMLQTMMGLLTKEAHYSMRRVQWRTAMLYLQVIVSIPKMRGAYKKMKRTGMTKILRLIFPKDGVPDFRMRPSQHRLHPHRERLYIRNPDGTPQRHHHQIS